MNKNPCEQLRPVGGEVLGRASQFCSKRENSVPGKKKKQNIIPCKGSERAAFSHWRRSCAPRGLHFAAWRGWELHWEQPFPTAELGRAAGWEQVHHSPSLLPHCLLRAVAHCQVPRFTRSIVLYEKKREKQTLQGTSRVRILSTCYKYPLCSSFRVTGSLAEEPASGPCGVFTSLTKH